MSLASTRLPLAAGSEDHEAAYERYLRARLVPRARLLSLNALVAGVLWTLLDVAFVSYAGRSLSLGDSALARAPWLLFPVLGIAAGQLAPRWRYLLPFDVAMSLGYCLASDWVFYRHGLGLSPYHVVMFLGAVMGPMALLPMGRAWRKAAYLVLLVGHMAIDLWVPDGRPLGLRLLTTAALVLGFGTAGFILEFNFTSHRRNFELRLRTEASLAALEASRGSVDAAVVTLAGSVARLTSHAGELAEGTAQGRDEAHDIARTASAMAGSAAALRERSRAGATLAEEVRTHAGSADALLGEVEVGVGAIDAAVARSTSHFRQLEARAERISLFVGTVQEIAAQTQMLAVNAGIEAGRAGAQGEGFAVIAREVRQLAAQASTSARDVVSVVQELSAQLSATAASVGEVREHTHRFLSAHGQTRELLQGVSDQVALTGAAMQDNASDAQRQAQAIEDISSATARLSGRVEGQSRLAEQVRATALELEALAQALRELLPGDAPPRDWPGDGIPPPVRLGQVLRPSRS